MSRIRFVLLIVLALLVAAAPAAARPAATTATTVTVTMKEFKFILSKTHVPHGKVTFKLVNRGKLVHDFVIAGKKSLHIKAGKTGRLVVTLTKGKHAYKCSIDSHAQFGMKGTLKVT